MIWVLFLLALSASTCQKGDAAVTTTTYETTTTTTQIYTTTTTTQPDPAGAYR